MTGRVLQFPGRSTSIEEGDRNAVRALAVPISERRERSVELQLDDPETLLGLCRKIREDIEVNPVRAQEEAQFLHGFVLTPKRVIGLFDERDYFLGETALLAGIASRVLARRDEASRWFDRSESSFRLTVNAVADWSRVSYQRLALLLEERRFDEVLEQLPGLVDSFDRLDMTEDTLKCRLIEGLARVEMGEFSSAAQAFEQVRLQAENAHYNNLLATALTNLVHVFGLLGDAEQALSCSKQALPIFARLGKRIHVGKIHWGIGSLLRAKGQYQAAIEAYGSARAEFEDLKMAADVAATRLMIADLHLELGDDQLALREVLFALPIVDEYRLVPEGVAALSLLRESVRQQKVNHQALRELHGFFEDAVS